MNAANPTRNLQGLIILAAAIGTVLLGVAPALAENASPTNSAARVSIVKQIARGGRDGTRGPAVQHEYAELQTGGTRTARSSKSAAGSSKFGSNDFWFYDADVILFGDDDYDGYYYGIDLLFDADTVFDDVAVYAVVLLSFEGGPWNEYAITDDFIISGATADDEYVVVTELESGYPAGNYDLLIELYDAIDGTFLAEFGPDDSSELSYLPLEDFRRDEPYVDNIVVVEHGGGAGFGLLWVLALPLLRLMRTGLRASGEPHA
ncbi:MAG: choice-of-anchor H family protein [Woeseia sp.]